MARIALIAVSLVALLGTTQVFSQPTTDRMPAREVTPGRQSTDCKTEMSKAAPMMNSMNDEKQKQETMKEMNMARDKMTKNDEEGCMSHMQNVHRMLGRPGQE
jgi:hypothetical protein